jgi:prepilin-type N-terminal cleavage/methylation domain-containing protein
MNDKYRRDQRTRGIAGQAAFTLVELLAVITIISIILVFILIASQDARRRAEERATQSLITKLESALNDRLDALLQSVPDANEAHKALAAIYITSGTTITTVPYTQQPTSGYNALQLTQRAQVLATYDYIKSELPDVFFVQNTAPSSSGYPLNFAANPFPGASTTGDSLNNGNYVLPLGTSVQGLPGGNSGYGDNNYTLPNSYAGTGIYGASYGAMAGIFKNLGYLPTGYDGVDNDGDGFIDNWLEGVGTGTTVSSVVTAHLQNHTHITARSETLYALLVEGRGPLGSAFSRDDFTDKEVQDTDGDGLPEFIDAWGNPLQFYRWPIMYHSDVQRGQVIINELNSAVYGGTYAIGSLVLPYSSVFEEREQSPLDLNQQLVAPAWWGSNLGPTGISFTKPISGVTVTLPSGAGSGDLIFEYFFHRLREPYGGIAASATTLIGEKPWDRAGTLRRAFYSKFLIVSAGQDQELGIFGFYPSQGYLTGPPDAMHLLALENNAMPIAYDLISNATISSATTSLGGATLTSGVTLNDAAQDDISNQNLQSVGGIGG